MLVLTVKEGDVVEIDTPSGPIKIHFRLRGYNPSKFRTGIDAPKDWPIRHQRAKHEALADRAAPPAEPSP